MRLWILKPGFMKDLFHFLLKSIANILSQPADVESTWQISETQENMRSK